MLSGSPTAVIAPGRARGLAHATMRNIRQNLFLSFLLTELGCRSLLMCYIPPQSSVFRRCSLARSSFTVVLNALRLYVVKL